MKPFVFISFGVFAGFLAWFGSLLAPQARTNASAITLCHTPSPDPMRLWALDPAFQALHAAPLPIQYVAKGSAITFPVADGAPASGYLLKSAKPSKKWLFVFQEWWGLNDYIRRESDKLHKSLGEEVNVLAIDMYDGKVADNPQEAGKLMAGTKEARLKEIVTAAYAYAGKNARVASVGWCFGGAWSLKSAILGGKNTIGSVMYYGMPVQDIEELKKLNSDVLGLFATETRISKEVVEKFDRNMKEAGKTLTYRIFPGVHGFANPSNPKYDAVNAQVAYQLTLDYLKRRFK